MTITKSQKRHLKKVEKRKEKREFRKQKQLQDQENSGKLIEENHNGGNYSVDFIEKACERYKQDLFSYNGSLLSYIRRMRPKYQTLLLKWPDNYPRNEFFYLAKSLLDCYRNYGEDSEIYLQTIIDQYGA